MKIRTMNYYMAEAFTSFRRNSFMSIASVATVALALFILGLFLCWLPISIILRTTWKIR